MPEHKHASSKKPKSKPHAAKAVQPPSPKKKEHYHFKADHFTLGAPEFKRPPDFDILPELLGIAEQAWKHFRAEQKRTGKRMPVKEKRVKYILKNYRVPNRDVKEGVPLTPSQAYIIAKVCAMLTRGGRPSNDDEG